MGILYYKLISGSMVSEYDMKRAYEISTGNTCKDFRAVDYRTYDFYTVYDKEYSRWLYNLLGKTIVKVIREQDITMRDCFDGRFKVKAVGLYREQHDCSIREAKECVDKLFSEWEQEGELK